MSDKNSEFAEEAEQERFENRRWKRRKKCLIVLENNSVNIDVAFFLLKEYKKIVEESEFQKGVYNC